MKRAVLVAAALAVIVMSFASCSHIEKMKYNDEGLLCGKSASYKYAPPGYEPTNQGEAYALIDNEMQETLYTVGEFDPTEWLTTEYCGAATMVYYSSDITLPTLAEMKPTVCHFCEQGESVSALYSIGEGGGEDEQRIIDTVVAMLNDDSLEEEMWPRGDVNETYQLKFYSPEWPAIYYNVVYGVCSSGNYVWDRVSDRCILIGDVLSEYHENTYDSGTGADVGT